MSKLREAGRSAMSFNDNLNLSQELPQNTNPPMGEMLPIATSTQQIQGLRGMRDSLPESDKISQPTAFNTKSQPELMNILKHINSKTKDQI
jgi:hypothetical protein